jgi:hypothetical protein
MKALKGMVILFLFLLALIFSGWTTQSSEIKKSFTREQLEKIFEENRRFEWIEEYQERDNAIFILTNRFLYRARLLDDNTVVFDQVKSRQDYDMQVPFWTIMLVIIISGAVLTVVFILPSRFSFFGKKKPY